ncbi:soluble inorganic pyrophosphatase 1 chloroplastic [Phtheirospermum japonicum]|uniref:inorganic diphosphatase n=1 Tax=Phtheirospermum japonicum TaxID=374723 RepID=A0A830BXM9_9LAMI|nr:soluble inorganic pyrophosphatase 1 chloroplastic [Phtheirospermum japonicum]
MAATRVIASASNAISGTLLSRSPLRAKPQTLSFSLKNNRLLTQKRRLFNCSAIYNPQIQTQEEGQPETLDYRVFFLDNSGKKISPWHDIPLHLGDGVFNFIVEIPKESSAKMEVATDELYTPIKQDTKKGKLRYYPRAKIGEVLKVKPLAALAMIDEGELDWKIIAISLDDPRANLVNDVDDVEKHFPGTLTAIRDWFRDYKIPDGKPANKFGLGNKPANKDFALKVITETNESWAKLVKRSIPAGELSLV